MGNACRVSALEDWSSHNFKDSVIVLRSNGEVMKVNRKILAGELMLQFPNHFLCHASSILLRRKSKMIQAKSELHPGKIYLLLPFPAGPDSIPTSEQHDLHEQEQDHQADQPLLAAPSDAPTAPIQGTTKFVISKQYLDRILSEKPSKSASRRSSPQSSKRASFAQRNKSKLLKRNDNTTTTNTNNIIGSNSTNQGPVQRRSTITWSPALDSIPEK